MNTARFEEGDVIFRHGDVLLKKTNKAIPKNKPIVAQCILHSGNNHNHSINGEFVLFEDSGKKFVGILGPTRLDHAEHGVISLKKRKTLLEVDIKVEYDHFLEESRQVID